MPTNIDHCARLLRLGDVCRTGIHGCSVNPAISIREGLVLRERFCDSIYALTRRNRIVTGFFVMLTTAQTVFGITFLASPDNTGKTTKPTSCGSGMLMVGPFH